MLPTYHCAKYLPEALQGILLQDPGPSDMQIMVVDDHSTLDDPASVIREVGGDRVGFIRHPCNLGAPENFNACVRASVGRWIHILHGDDAILPGFYAACRTFIERHPNLVLVFSLTIVMDCQRGHQEVFYPSRLPRESGLLGQALPDLLEENFICTPSVVVARSAYERVGGFNPLLPHSADWEMWMRVACLGPIGFLAVPYGLYRVHEASDSSKRARDASNFVDYVQAIRLGVRHLPQEQRDEALRKAYRAWARHANTLRRQCHQAGAHSPALRYALWGVKLHPSPRNMWRLLRTSLRRAIMG